MTLCVENAVTYADADVGWEEGWKGGVGWGDGG